MKKRQKPLTDEQWELIEPLLPPLTQRRDKCGPQQVRIKTSPFSSLSIPRCESISRDRRSHSDSGLLLVRELGGIAEGCGSSEIDREPKGGPGDV
jgi:hypothetical protein